MKINKIILLLIVCLISIASALAFTAEVEGDFYGSLFNGTIGNFTTIYQAGSQVCDNSDNCNYYTTTQVEGMNTTIDTNLSSVWGELGEKADADSNCSGGICTDVVYYGDYLNNLNYFYRKGVFDANMNNFLASADHRFNITFTNENYSKANLLFNGNWETAGWKINNGTNSTLNIDLLGKNEYGANGIVYTIYSYVIITAYPFRPVQNIWASAKDKNGVWTNFTSITDISNPNAFAETVWRLNIPINNYLTELEITVQGKGNESYNNETWITQIEMYLPRQGQNPGSALLKYGDQSIYADLAFKDSSNEETVDIDVETGRVTATILSGGLHCNNITGNSSDVCSGSSTDTNETTRFNTLVGTDCSGDDKMTGIGADGTPVCEADNDSGSVDTNETDRVDDLIAQNVTIYSEVVLTSGSNPLTSGWDAVYQINSTDWSNVTITESQISDLSHTTDTNESTRFNTLVGTDCSGDDKMTGIDANGAPVCEADNDSGGANTNCSISGGCATVYQDVDLVHDHSGGIHGNNISANTLTGTQIDESAFDENIVTTGDIDIQGGTVLTSTLDFGTTSSNSEYQILDGALTICTGGCGTTESGDGNLRLEGNIYVNGDNIYSDGTLVINPTTELQLGSTNDNVEVYDGGLCVGDGGCTPPTDGNLLLEGDLAVNGDDITCDSNLDILATGYVRIGDTSSPGSATGDDDAFIQGDLEVDGIIYADGTTAMYTKSKDMVFRADSGYEMKFYASGDLDDFITFETVSGHPMINTSGASDIYMDPSGGQVYIGHYGCTTCAADLYVYDGVLRVYDGGSATVNHASADGDLYVEDDFEVDGIYNLADSGHAIGVASDGRIYDTTASSQRFKENIVESDLTLNQLKQLKIVDFDWKEEYVNITERDFGLVAEETCLVIPELCTYDRDGSVFGTNYLKTGVAALKFLQLQQTKIEQFEADLQLQQAKNEQMQSKIIDLETRLGVIEKYLATK